MHNEKKDLEILLLLTDSDRPAIKMVSAAEENKK